ncbi:MAG: hydrogenase expression/formation protein HypE [Phycisphaerae bacterium]|nr:hydrogenase expression/formation protein HypE [Phycisphaerae bacterium]
MKNNDKITMGHGGGGQLTSELLNSTIFVKLANEHLDKADDGAVLDCPFGQLCFTTDSYVIDPIFFPGGDIGKLAVCGTVNDLAVMGAIPRWLSLSLIISEGLSFTSLNRIIDSIAAATKEANVQIVTGDTKVIESYNSKEEIYINTAGIGFFVHEKKPDIKAIVPGDKIIINGPIADHGIAIMCVRESLGFETKIKSDAGALNSLVKEVMDAELDIRFMRDATRGGLAMLLVDIAEATNLGIEINENAIPINASTRHAAELLGLDPLTTANEGKCVFVVSAEDADRTLEICRSHPLGQKSKIIGTVTGNNKVEMITDIGGRRIITRPLGKELPRIC